MDTTVPDTGCGWWKGISRVPIVRLPDICGHGLPAISGYFRMRCCRFLNQNPAHSRANGQAIDGSVVVMCNWIGYFWIRVQSWNEPECPSGH
jgi:hypothetical protein